MTQSNVLPLHQRPVEEMVDRTGFEPVPLESQKPRGGLAFTSQAPRTVIFTGVAGDNPVQHSDPNGRPINLNRGHSISHGRTAVNNFFSPNFGETISASMSDGAPRRSIFMLSIFSLVYILRIYMLLIYKVTNCRTVLSHGSL